jgi:hypothetical protein
MRRPVPVQEVILICRRPGPDRSDWPRDGKTYRVEGVEMVRGEHPVTAEGRCVFQGNLDDCERVEEDLIDAGWRGVRILLVNG